MTELYADPLRVDNIDALHFTTIKTPRERLITLHIEARICSRVFSRVLRLLTSDALIPVDVVVEQDSKFITIDLQIDRDNFVPSSWLLGQIEGIPAVRSADFLDYRGLSLFPAKVSGDGELMATGSQTRTGRLNGTVSSIQD